MAAWLNEKKKSVISARAAQTSGWARIGDLKWRLWYKTGVQQIIIIKKNISQKGTNNLDTVLYTLIERRTCTSKCLLHIELWMYIFTDAKVLPGCHLFYYLNRKSISLYNLWSNTCDHIIHSSWLSVSVDIKIYILVLRGKYSPGIPSNML